MFLDYFGFEKQPFGATPDPNFLYESNSHREALASLYCGFYANRGFTTLIAQPGMGKTTLLFEFLDHIRATRVFLFNTLCEPGELLSLILRDLAITPSQSPADQYGQLYDLLTVEGLKGRQVVLVIDEAQNLSIRALEAVRLPSNFESTCMKLMQVVLSGQPQLADMLSLPEVTQLRQRISTVCRLDPLSPTDISAYIEHRIVRAGGKRRDLFAPPAIDLIVEASKGIPRTINTLCFNSLCLCRARQERQVNREMVRDVVRDLEFPVTKAAATPVPEPTSVPVSITPLEHKTEAKPFWVRRWLYAAAILIVACLGTGVARHFTLAAPQTTRSVKVDASRDAEVLAPGHQEGVSTPTKSQVQPTNPAAPATVTVAPGDTLEQIGTTHVGTFNGTVLREIRALNPRITDPDHIETGPTLRLPSTDGPAVADAQGSR